MDQFSRVEECSMQELIIECKSKYETVWWETSTGFPAGLSPYTRKQQKEGEQRLQQFIRKLNLAMKSPPKEESEQSIWRENLKNSILQYYKHSLDLNDGGADLLFIEAFMRVAEEFSGKAKDFDPGINMEDIIQALRNVWTMNSIQIMYSEKVCLTPPNFAYSMLYPYTDNYLDNPHIPLQLKNEINLRFKKRLQGAEIVPLDDHEQKIFDLIQLIEEYYPRTGYPEVYESLYAIHSAQVKSLLLQSQKTVPYETDIIGISFEKGGTSVLADGFLIKGKLNRGEAFFFFGYGVLLQLIDDLRDAASDSKNGHMTLFSQLVKKWPLDRLTNRLFNFSAKVLSEGEPFCEPQFIELIGKSCSFLIMEAIAHNREFYKKEYLNNLENHTPLRLTYLRKLKPKLKKKFNTLNELGIGMPVSTLIRTGVALSQNSANDFISQ